MWFVRVGSQVNGPFSEEELRSLRNRGEFSPIHQISVDGRRWKSAVDLVRILDANPPELRVHPQVLSRAAASVAREAKPVPSNPAAPNLEWYYLDSTRRHVGPVPEEELWSLFYTKRLTERTLVCKTGETSWIRAGRHPDLTPLLSSTNRSIRAIAVCATLVVCILSIPLSAFLWLTDRSNSQAKTKMTGPLESKTQSVESISAEDTPTGDEQAVITSVDDRSKIRLAVGLVVCGWTVRRNDHDVEDVQQSSGSCFSVSRDGYLIASRNLIEKIAGHMALQPEQRIKAYCELRAAEEVESISEHGTKVRKRQLNQLRSRYDPERFEEIVPKIWVFFGSKERIYEATVIPSDLRDVSILMINRQSSPYFRLADISSFLKKANMAYAVGFLHAVGERAIADQGGQPTQQRVSISARIQEQFSAAELDFSLSKGEVRRIVGKTQNQQRLEYSESLNVDSPGGPLVAQDATVIGINIRMAHPESEITRRYYAQTTDQLRAQIGSAISRHKNSTFP